MLSGKARVDLMTRDEVVEVFLRHVQRLLRQERSKNSIKIVRFDDGEKC